MIEKHTKEAGGRNLTLKMLDQKQNKEACMTFSRQFLGKILNPHWGQEMWGDLAEVNVAQSI